MRASDIFKPQPTPPQMYYLKDHVRVEYSDSDWPTTSKGEGEASTEGGVNDLSRTSTAGDASMVVRLRPPLGLPSVRMREHREKGNVGSNGSANREMPEEGCLASPGILPVPFPHIFTHPCRSQAICAGREGGYPARTTARLEM